MYTQTIISAQSMAEHYLSDDATKNIRILAHLKRKLYKMYNLLPKSVSIYFII